MLGKAVSILRDPDGYVDVGTIITSRHERYSSCCLVTALFVGRPSGDAMADLSDDEIPDDKSAENDVAELPQEHPSLPEETARPEESSGGARSRRVGALESGMEGVAPTPSQCREAFNMWRPYAWRTAVGLWTLAVALFLGATVPGIAEENILLWNISLAVVVLLVIGAAAVSAFACRATLRAARVQGPPGSNLNESAPGGAAALV